MCRRVVQPSISAFKKPPLLYFGLCMETILSVNYSFIPYIKVLHFLLKTSTLCPTFVHHYCGVLGPICVSLHTYILYRREKYFPNVHKKRQKSAKQSTTFVYNRNLLYRTNIKRRTSTGIYRTSTVFLFDFFKMGVFSINSWDTCYKTH